MTWSPIQKAVDRVQLQQASSEAIASALMRGSHLLPPGPVRAKVARWAKRTQACAATTYIRIVTRPGQASFIMRSNKRACLARWCPLCEAKRANAALRNLIDLTDYVFDIAPRARPLMLTLTSLNAVVFDAGPQIYLPSRTMLINHQRALKAFFAYKRVQSAILGHVTSIECDFAVLNGQLTVHWHSHSLLLAAPGALSDERYIRQTEYVALWKRALGVPYKPIVDIRTVRSRDGSTGTIAALKSGCREVLKYSLDTDLFDHINGTISADPRAAVAFAVASYRRRLVSMDRIFLDAKRRCRAHRKNSGESPTTNPAEHAGYSPPSSQPGD